MRGVLLLAMVAIVGCETSTAPVDSAPDFQVPDHAPTTPTILLTLAQPGIGSTLRVELVDEARDADLDPLTYRYVWSQNGAVVRDGPAADVGPELTAEGDVWTVQLYVDDGTLASASDVVNATIHEVPPVGPEVTFAPNPPAEIRDAYGFHSRRWVDLTVSTDGTTGERTATGRVEIDEGRYNASTLTGSACDLYWSLVATEDPSVCADCTYAFSVAYTYDAAASTAGDFCADHPSGDSGGTLFFRTETAAFSAVLDDV